MIQLLVTVIILGLIFAIAVWAIDRAPLPQPFKWAAEVILALIIIVILLSKIGIA